MLPLWALALAFEEPPVADVATVAFSADGRLVAVETHWVDEGPGFPNARVELRSTDDNRLVGAWSERLVEHAAASGFAGASEGARRKAAAALAEAGIDLTKPAAALPCASGVCGPPDAGGGCARRRDALRVTVTSTPTDAKAEQCYGRGRAHRLQLAVQGRTWVAETAPVDGCPANWTAEAAYLQGERAVLLLGYDIPGHEGRAKRRTAVAGRAR